MLFLIAGCGGGAQTPDSGKGSSDAPTHSDAWAVIAATSQGWDNYRHQADALAIYDLLKGNGMADDHIILMIVDDIKDDPRNPEKGTVRNREKGPNLREGAQVDYSGDAVTVNNLALALLGIEGISGPAIASGQGSDVFLYLVGHGENASLSFVNGPGVSADALATVVDRMHDGERYGRLFMVVETCDAADFGNALSSPGALFFGSCSQGETSQAINYDPGLKAWLADEFSYAIWDTASKHGDMALSDFLSSVNDQVTDSHTVVLNSDNFGSLSSIPLWDFIAP